MKEITMVATARTARNKYGYQGSRTLVRVSETVDLSRMSALASAIAESISTTESADDLSLIWVHGGLTVYEKLMKEGKPEEAERVSRQFGDLAHRKESIAWKFDLLNADETPEEYFERQAELMRKIGASCIVARNGRKFEIESNQWIA